MRKSGIIPRFFSRGTKPSLLPLLLITAAVVIIESVLIATDADSNSAYICIVMTIYALITTLVLLWAFREQLGYDPYSYNTIFYMGYALFSLFMMVTYVFLSIHVVQEPEIYRWSMSIHTLTSSAKNYMILTGPFILVFSIGLCVSNVTLIRREGKRLVNLLGIILSLMLLGGWVLMFVFDFAVSGSMIEVMTHDLIVNLFASVYLYFECMLIGTMTAGAITALYEPDLNRNCMIILGCGLRKDGTPTPLLAGRIDSALRYNEMRKSLTGKDLSFITSGGQGADETVSESASMKRYLIEHNIPSEQIFEENRSCSTLENMQFSSKIIRNIDPDAKVAFSTNNYHVFRSGVFASSTGMKAIGIGAKTKWYFWPNAAVREFVSLLTRQKTRQAVILVSMAVFYAAMTLVSYLAY